MAAVTGEDTAAVMEAAVTAAVMEAAVTAADFMEEPSTTAVGWPGPHDLPREPCRLIAAWEPRPCAGHLDRRWPCGSPA
jgi:hypothetical protein